jgi:Gas vesicle synthesis protein GvpL/GvpF
MTTTTAPHADTLWYVYGIVPAGLATPSLPAGLDDAELLVERDAGVAALVSRLDASAYAPEAIERNSADVEWLGPRAVAHDRVLSWASEHGAVVPLPMFSLFSGLDAVRSMLRDRAPQLTATLERVGRGREYALRVYRVDAELLAVIATLSPRLEALASSAASASPGQRYLLERKLESQKRAELRGTTQDIVDEIVNELSTQAIDTIRSPIPRLTDAEGVAGDRGTMVLNAAFLVAPDRLESFQRTLTTLIGHRGAQGFRFDFTGPWPPYHFSNESADGD